MKFLAREVVPALFVIAKVIVNTPAIPEPAPPAIVNIVLKSAYQNYFHTI